MIVIEGIPLFYLELAVGQRLRKGAVGSWNQVCTTMTSFRIYINYDISLFILVVRRSLTCLHNLTHKVYFTYLFYMLERRLNIH